MDISTLNLQAGTVAPASPQAYSRVQCVSDFVDIVFLALSGYDVAYEPVSGSLSGFGRPMPVSTILRISAQHPEIKPERSKLPVWHIVVDDTPQSIAKAFRSLLTEKSSITGIVLDLTIIGQGDRAIAIETMFSGVTRCLNQRAGRLLDNGDIADLLDYVAAITPSKMDAQVLYGSYPHWGAFMRREQVDPARAWTSPPVVVNATRTLLCIVKPAAEDLQQLVTIGRPFGLVNMAALRLRAPWAASVSADHSLSMGYTAAVPVASYEPSAAIIAESKLPIPPAPPGRNIHASVEERYATVWRDLRTISAALYAKTREALPANLSPSWDERRTAIPAYGIILSPVVGDTADHARHALDAGIKASRGHDAPMPVAAVTAIATDLDSGVAYAHDLIGHGGVVIVSDLRCLDVWHDLVSVVVTP